MKFSLFILAFALMCCSVEAQDAAFMDMFCQDWTLVEIYDGQDQNLPLDPDGNNRFVITKDYGITAHNKNEEGYGLWKYDAKNKVLHIADKKSGSTVMYKVLELTADRLVLFFPDEIQGQRKLVYRPLN